MWSAPAAAAVEITFYARDLGGTNFPHTFVALHGVIDATHRRIDTTIGFNAVAFSPQMLFEAVDGAVAPENQAMIDSSTREFSITVDDAHLRAVATVIRRYRAVPQPNYNVHSHNCVSFVGDVAQAAGLRVTFSQRLLHRPREFLEAVREANPRVTFAAR